MPAINLTHNTDLILTAKSTLESATLNRYLKSILTFQFRSGFHAVSSALVKDQREGNYPLLLSAAGEGRFALEKTQLIVQQNASASIGVLQSANEAAFFTALDVTADPSSSGLVSFSLSGTHSADDKAKESDLTFGMKEGVTFTLTSYRAAAAGETLLQAIETAIETLTIPHDIDDLESMPPQAICRLDAIGTLKFSASFTYSFLNDPLASLPLGKLPSFDIGASASATLEGAVTHSSGHTVTIARLSKGLIHISVSLTSTDDFETSIKVSSGLTAKAGDQDALAFLLDKINPNSAAEAQAIASEMHDPAAFRSDIKTAIDTSLSAALAVSLKAALERTAAKCRLFVYEVDLNGLDARSTEALQAALTGDFTLLTKTGADWNGIHLLDSAFTVTATRTHTLALHFLGIFNAASIHRFVAKSKIDFTKDTHEIVLSDESIETFNNNLDAEKLRKLLLKQITLTLPASANTKEAKTPITLAYIDREGATDVSKMRQFVNVMTYLSAPQTSAAQALLIRNLSDYGACTLALQLCLAPAQCKQLFSGPNGWYGWRDYVAAFCAAGKIITSGVSDFAYRSVIFDADRQTWGELHEDGSQTNIVGTLKKLGLSDLHAGLGSTDVTTALWWADAMAGYATALQYGHPIESAAKAVVKDSNAGYNEPWMVLAAWALAGKPAIAVEFATSLPQPALSATAPLHDS